MRDWGEIKMVFVNKSFRQMMKKIKFQRFIRKDRISPKDNADIFRIHRPLLNESYLESTLEKLDLPDRYTVVEFKFDGCNFYYKYRDFIKNLISEAMLNCYERGHKRNGNLKISFRIAEGQNGYVLRFRDQGNGFDYLERIKKLRTNQEYWERSGSCFAFLDSPDVEASYEGNGKILNVKIMKKTTMGELRSALENLFGGD
jgi:anti-sigma regulatory factor (Ser/Thr protein kinase)